MASTKNERYGLMSFTGPAGRMYYDRDGVLQTADENEIREEYDPLTGAYRGMLIEAHDRTNYTPNSKDLGGIPGSEDGSTKIAPDGSEVKGYKIAGNTFFERFEGWSSDDDSLTTSVWVCANKPVTLKLRKPLNSGREEVDCHITTEWQRFSATSFRENGYSGGENKTLLDGRHISDESIVVYAFGFQVESGPGPTSYIETNGLPVTMPGEDARFTDPAVFNNLNRGTLVTEIETLQIPDVTALSSVIYSDVNRPLVGKRNGRLGAHHDETESSVLVSDYNPSRHIVAVTFRNQAYTASVDGVAGKDGSYTQWSSDDKAPLVIGGPNWAGYIRSLDFIPDSVTPEVLKTLSSGIVYDDIHSLFKEKEIEGVYYKPSVANLMRIGIVRSGFVDKQSSVGFIEDLSGNENHALIDAQDEKAIYNGTDLCTDYNSRYNSVKPFAASKYWFCAYVGYFERMDRDGGYWSLITPDSDPKDNNNRVIVDYNHYGNHTSRYIRSFSDEDNQKSMRESYFYSDAPNHRAQSYVLWAWKNESEDSIFQLIGKNGTEDTLHYSLNDTHGLPEISEESILRLFSGDRDQSGIIHLESFVFIPEKFSEVDVRRVLIEMSSKIGLRDFYPYIPS